MIVTGARLVITTHGDDPRQLELLAAVLHQGRSKRVKLVTWQIVTCD